LHENTGTMQNTAVKLGNFKKRSKPNNILQHIFIIHQNSKKQCRYDIFKLTIQKHTSNILN